MTSLYNVGDIVVVRGDLKEGYYKYEDTNVSKLNAVDEMLQYRGMEVKIVRRLRVRGEDAIAYSIAEDDNEWLWCADMFEGLAGETYDMSVDIGCLIGG